MNMMRRRFRLLLLVSSSAFLAFGGCSAARSHMRDSPEDLTEIPATPSEMDVIAHLEQLRVHDEWLRDYAQRLPGHIDRPWTPGHLASASSAETDPGRKAALVYVLAASRTVTGLRHAGPALYHESPEVACAAAEGIEQYWMGVSRAIGNDDSLIEDAREWWKRWQAQYDTR